MKLNFAAAAVTAFLAGSVAHAATFSFATLDDPADPTFNQLLGINNAGVIAGYFGSGMAVGHPNKGYTIAAPYKTFVHDDLPGSVQTQATGINDFNATSGFWSDTNLGTGDNNFGFARVKRRNGSLEYLSIIDPLIGGHPLVDQVLGINNKFNTVGFYNDAQGNSHGFAYSLRSNVFTPVNVPNSTVDAATGINNGDYICGFYVNATGVMLGFVKQESHDPVISFGVPNAQMTQLLGINDYGQTVGVYTDQRNVMHGLYYNAVSGAWQPVNAPRGVNGTVVNGLNDRGQLVGFYIDAHNNTHGMVVTVKP